MKKNKAVHKGNGLLPYPVIVSASQGDILAMNVVLAITSHTLPACPCEQALTNTAILTPALTRICVAVWKQN